MPSPYNANSEQNIAYEQAIDKAIAGPTLASLDSFSVQRLKDVIHNECLNLLGPWGVPHYLQGGKVYGRTYDIEDITLNRQMTMAINQYLKKHSTKYRLSKGGQANTGIIIRIAPVNDTAAKMMVAQNV